MGSLTDVAEARVLDWTVGNSTTAPTAPMKLALLTANGTDSAAGTEVVGGSYSRQTITFGAASSNVTNSNAPAFTALPACTVTGWAVYDSAGTRWWHGAWDTPRTVLAGDGITLSVGELNLTAD